MSSIAHVGPNVGSDIKSLICSRIAAFCSLGSGKSPNFWGHILKSLWGGGKMQRYEVRPPFQHSTNGKAPFQRQNSLRSVPVPAQKPDPCPKTMRTPVLARCLLSKWFYQQSDSGAQRPASIPSNAGLPRSADSYFLSGGDYVTCRW